MKFRSSSGAGPKRAKAMADEAFAVRALDALADRPVPAVRDHDGVRII